MCPPYRLLEVCDYFLGGLGPGAGWCVEGLGLAVVRPSCLPRAVPSFSSISVAQKNRGGDTVIRRPKQR